MAKAQITLPLEIPDVRVLKTEISPQGEVIITVESTKKETRCRKCGRTISKFHGYDDWVQIRYLPVFGRSSYLRYRPRRYQCMECADHATTTQRLEWHERGSQFTLDYEDHVLVQLIHSTIEDVRIKEGLSYDSVLGVLERRIDPAVNWANFSQLGTLGLDEIAPKKGQGHYLVIVTSQQADGRLTILGVLPDRQKATVLEFLRSIPERLKRTIHTVCSDMYEGYTEAVREVLPHARLVIDRFHVAETYREGLDRLRKEELHRLKGELPEDDYRLLKGSMWALRKSLPDLSPQEHQVLKRLFGYSPALKLAYDLQRQLTAIFDRLLTQTRAKVCLRAWVKRVRKSGLHCFDPFLATLEARWEEITTFFVARANSGFVEGLNNKLKVLKRRCYGLFNRQHWFQRIFLDLEGYRWFGLA
jgi:transposase